MDFAITVIGNATGMKMFTFANFFEEKNVKGSSLYFYF